MRKQSSRFVKISSSLICATCLFACSNSEENQSAASQAAVAKAETLNTIGDEAILSVINEKVSYSDEDFYSEWKNGTTIQLNGSSASAEGNGGVVIEGNIINIRTSGVYVISGKLDDGQIIVNAEDKGTVRLILNGAEIHSSTSSPLYIEQAGKTVISLEDGTTNELHDAKSYVNVDSESNEPDAALFSKDDLTINGTGTLIVNGNYNNGITSKDALYITGGSIQVDAVDDGIIGRDLVAVKDGEFSITAGGDGIKSTNDKDEEKAPIAIEAGTFDIEAGNDGIQSETSLFIADGTFTISTGDGSPEVVATNENNRPTPSRTNETNTNETETETETESTKGLKAAIELAIGGGGFEIDSLDDAIHSNQSITIIDGKFTLATGDDALHADKAIYTKGGNITVTKSYEGIESQSITIAGGEIEVNSVDDGINVGGGVDGSGMDMAQAEASETNLLSINGGTIYVNAEGDGLDANGSILMTDGTVIVNGPTNNNNGSLDYDQTFEISGGLLIAAGSSGMMMATSDTSTQNTITMNYPTVQAADTLIHLEDSDGNSIATFAPVKEYQSVIISSPKLASDTSYTLYSGGTAKGTGTNGLYTNGMDQAGTKVVDFTISNTVTWLNESGVTEAQAGMGGPRGGGQMGGVARGGMFSNLDEETRKKVQSIMEQQRNSTISREEAEAQLAELGIEFPAQNGREIPNEIPNDAPQIQ
ncbi:carbohydrate-binding domain-containing protein [Metabacillus malikii]|uniref:Carbohydrate-binding domain-containing protein n=1 Tax=Metabacillus malikii TaxID=1504265 RepID=A0ABT9ZHU5_9BACI|nr:carbohydrate-binding domain-containing protein [Metabacillus malikii]MDQ0231842.1 hypothetical protein [Metabacillus malikii]